MSASDERLLALIDRLTAILDRSELTELEVGAGGTGLVLRKPEPVAQPAGPAATARPARTQGADPAGDPAAASAPVPDPAPAAPAGMVVAAPLTGIFYASPNPTAAPFVTVGQEIVVGQVIGLIEAMKLFNEIKSDKAGRIVRIVAENGGLVKAKQPLIEVEPL